jgi:hypothetical protein
MAGKSAVSLILMGIVAVGMAGPAQAQSAVMQWTGDSLRDSATNLAHDMLSASIKCDYSRYAELLKDYNAVGQQALARHTSMENWSLPPSYNYERCTQRTGLNGGVQISKTKGDMEWDETDSNSGKRTNHNSASKDPMGVGVNIGYGFRPWSNNLVVNPFLSFDYLNLSVNYMFPNGSIIGARSNYEGTAGVKIGPTYPSGVWLYVLAGVSFLNETLTVNFIPVSSSTTKTVPGVTLGLGGAIQPDWLQVFGLPASLFLEYQHNWWQTANFNMPASSPGFNYAFKREDDKIKLGVNVYFSAPTPPPPTQGLITK